MLKVLLPQDIFPFASNVGDPKFRLIWFCPLFFVRAGAAPPWEQLSVLLSGSAGRKGGAKTLFNELATTSIGRRGYVLTGIE
jgi:hypothetical protein